MTHEIDTFKMECQLVKLNGLAQALILLSHSDEFQERQREAIGGMAEAFEDQFNTLWRLMYDHDYRDGADKPEPSQEAEV